jgi:hypothetical protein
MRDGGRRPELRDFLVQCKYRIQECHEGVDEFCLRFHATAQFRCVSEIEFCSLDVVVERWTLGCMLGFVRAKNDFSDTLSGFPFYPPADHEFLVNGAGTFTKANHL